MALAYVKPGVTVSEIVSPSFSPLLLDPTSICIVGPAQGYEPTVEVFVLDDNHEVQLQKLNVDTTTLVVRDASNVTLAPFAAGASADYTVDTSLLATSGVVKIKRSMQTTIADGEKVVVYFENSAAPVQGDGKTESLELDKITPEAPVNRAAGTQTASIKVMKAGLAPAADYTIANAGAPGTTIVWKNTATVLQKFQTVYLDFSVGATQYTDQPYQLNNLTTVSLPDNATSIVVKTAAGAPTATTASLYTKGTTTDGDYILGGSGATLTIARSAGTTTIGAANDKLTVRVSYNATPSDYWLPTRCFSQFDVENKYGPAFDSSGNILNAVSFAASLAFSNGANSVIVQALFAEGTPRTKSTGTVTDWENTLVNLRDIEDINVIVPLISAGGLSTSDAQNLQILTAVQNHISYMAQQQNQLVIAVCGEDSTGGTMASKATLQSHAQSLGANAYSDHIVLLDPAAYTFANPVTGLTSAMGGQYVAACVAGMLARYPVQTPLTRKRVNAVIGVTETRTETDKDQSAQAGLTEIEAKRGRIQVRHAITTSQDSVAARELSVVRAKHYMMENIRQALEEQVVGQIILDDAATFKVQLLVTAELQQLVDLGSIVSFSQIQVSRDTVDPTAIQVRFSYLPSFPLNTVSITFSINSSAGVTFNTTSAANVQGI